MSGWSIQYYNTKWNYAWECCSVLETSTSNCFPTLQICSMNLENPNAAQPCMRTAVIRFSVQDLQKSELTQTVQRNHWAQMHQNYFASLHTDIFNIKITSNSNKFYPYIFKIHDGIISLRLHSCVLGYLGKDNLHQSQPVVSSHQQWTNNISKNNSWVLCDIPSLLKTIPLYNFP